MADVFWVYSLDSALRLGRELQALGVEWMEAPLQSEDVASHAALARQLDMNIAVGEPLRSRYQFAEWLRQEALDIAQPDIARCGLTEGRRIAELAAAHHRPVALHLGVCLGVGMLATWHLAAALPSSTSRNTSRPCSTSPTAC